MMLCQILILFPENFFLHVKLVLVHQGWENRHFSLKAVILSIPFLQQLSLFFPNVNYVMDKWSCFWKFNNFFFANIVYDVLSFLSVICILEKKKSTSKCQEISINE